MTVARLSNNVRGIRADLRMSQEELARRVRVTRQTIGAIENEQYAPSALLAFLIARELGKSVTDLFHLTEEP